MSIDPVDEAVALDEEELRLFVARLMHLMNVWTIYNDLLSKKYIPSTSAAEYRAETDIISTVMFTLYSYFYSLVEDSDDGLNAFRVWRRHFPGEEVAIAAMERRVIPFRDSLRVFRNRVGAHGSRTRAHEAKGLDFFGKHSGTEMWNAITLFKHLAAGLLVFDTGCRRGDAAKTAQGRAMIDRVIRESSSGHSESPSPPPASS